MSPSSPLLSSVTSRHPLPTARALGRRSCRPRFMHQKNILDYVVELPARGGRGVFTSGVILTAAHCITFTTEGEMALGDDFVEEVRAGARRLKVAPLAVEPVSDIALLGALDDQVFYEEAQAYEEFCALTRGATLFAGRIKARQPLAVRILDLDNTWINGTVKLFDEHAPRLWLKADRQISGGCSGGPILTASGGDLVALVSNSSIPNKSVTGVTGLCPRPLYALPVWACRKYFAAASPSRLSFRTHRKGARR